MRRRLASLALGTLVTLICTELLLALSQWAFVRYQERQNLAAIERGEAEIRILTIGESTTAVAGDEKGKLLVTHTAYPAQLERILNKRQNTYTFRVINNGMMGGTSSTVLAMLEPAIRTYKPHFIVAMMGIKDTPDQQLPGSAALPGWMRSLRTVQLGVWLYEGVMLRQNQVVTDVDDVNDLPEALRVKSSQLSKYIKETRMVDGAPEMGAADDLELGTYLWFIQRHDRAEQVLRRAIETWDVGYNLLALVLQTCNRGDDAQGLMRQAVADHDSEGMYRVTLVELLTEAARYDEAERVVDEAWDAVNSGRVLEPELVASYLAMEEAKLARDQGQYARSLQVLDAHKAAESAVKAKHSRFFPSVSGLWHSNMGETYLMLEDWPLAEKHLTRAVDIQPGHHANMWLLSQVYRRTGRPEKEEELRRQLLIRSGRVAEYYELAKLFKLQGQSERIPALMDEAVRAIPSLSRSYESLYDTAERHHIQLVVMQYPSFSLDVLHKYAPPRDGVIFIDNEDIFGADPDAYFFEPRFPHSFSHYTEQGAEILAGHVADVILASFGAREKVAP